MAFKQYEKREPFHVPDEDLAFLLKEPVLKSPPISNERTIACLQLYRRTGEVRYRDEIVTGHLKMILSQARSLCPPSRHISISDILQECILGFIKGLDKYDFDHPNGAKITSVAIIWARKQVFEYLTQQANTVFLGHRPQAAARKGEKLTEQFIREHELSSVAIDIVLSDMSKGERLGAIDVMANSNTDPLEPIEDLPDTCHPTTSEPIDFHHLQHICRGLEEEEREILFSYYKLTTLSFEDTCFWYRITPQQGKSVVSTAIKKVKAGDTVMRLF